MPPWADDMKLLLPIPTDPQDRKILLAAIKAQMFAALTPSVFAPIQAQLRDSLTEFNDTIARLELVMTHADLAPFRIGDVARWTGQRLLAFSPPQRTKRRVTTPPPVLLLHAPRAIRIAAIEILAGMDVESLPRRSP